MVSQLWFERDVTHFPTKIVFVLLFGFHKQIDNCSWLIKMYFLTQDVPFPIAHRQLTKVFHVDFETGSREKKSQGNVYHQLTQECESIYHK